MPDDLWIKETEARLLRGKALTAKDIAVARGADTTFTILQENADLLLTEGGDFLLQES